MLSRTSRSEKTPVNHHRESMRPLQEPHALAVVAEGSLIRDGNRQSMPPGPIAAESCAGNHTLRPLNRFRPSTGSREPRPLLLQLRLEGHQLVRRMAAVLHLGVFRLRLGAFVAGCRRKHVWPPGCVARLPPSAAMPRWCAHPWPGARRSTSSSRRMPRSPLSPGGSRRVSIPCAASTPAGCIAMSRTCKRASRSVRA